MAHSDLEKAEALVRNLESQFQPVPVPPAQAAAVETVREFMQSFAFAPTSEPQLTTLAEVSKTIKELKVINAPGLNGVPNTALRYLPDWALTVLAVVFNAVLRLQYCLSVWKHTHVISILKSGKYLETYFIALERWLREWRIAINVDKSMTVLFSPPRRRIINPQGLMFLGGENSPISGDNPR